jgi:hypothetical protein
MCLFQWEEEKIPMLKSEFRNFILENLMFYKIKAQLKFCEIWDSQVSEYEGLLNCDTMLPGRRWKERVPLKW